jgi:hypothetical protein
LLRGPRNDGGPAGEPPSCGKSRLPQSKKPNA